MPLPNEEMKGRIIGREGRNIRAIEQATGVDLIIDETPEAITLSAFDPVRREVARRALTKLIADGRIHPARIEEVVTKAKAEVEKPMREEGEKAAFAANVQGLHPDLIKLLGRLSYRTSYGQNQLHHVVEAATIAAAIAAEIGADVNVAKTATLLHDIGKAVDHEVEGPHALIGAEIRQASGPLAQDRPRYRLAPQRGRAEYCRGLDSAGGRRALRGPPRSAARQRRALHQDAWRPSRPSPTPSRELRRASQSRQAAKYVCW